MEQGTKYHIIMCYQKLIDKAEGLLLKKKAEEGDAEFMWRVGECYSDGTHGFNEDENLAYEWYKKSSDLKNPAGMLHAGDSLINGCGVEENVSYGMTLVGVAAMMGSDEACYCLGEWHFYGENGLPRDKAEAKHWLTKAVDGSCSANHLDDERKERAREWLEELEEGFLLKKKAEEGDAESMWRLGECYFCGTHGFSEDDDLAYEWYKKSSDLKHPAGMFCAGNSLMRGIGGEKNASYGLSLVSMAAVTGSDYACYFLGEWHFKGENGLPQDKAEAKHWITKAVDGSCSVKHLNLTSKRNMARKHLKKLEERQE